MRRNLLLAATIALCWAGLSDYVCAATPLAKRSLAQVPPPGPTTTQPGVTTQAQGASRQLKPVPKDALDLLKQETAETEGTLFLSADQVMVKPPVLKALITLNQSLSPYSLEASGSRGIGLPEVLKEALSSNQAIKVSHADWQSSRWQYYSSLGNFLPDIVNQFSIQELYGKYASPFGLLSGINSPYISIPTGLQWYFFRGGAIVYGALQAKHTAKAAEYRLQSDTNDILLDAADQYYNLVLQDILLQIRIKAVQTSKALLLRNEIQFENGANTMLDVLQAKTQLSRDRQALISQQVARRQAAIKLAHVLNADTGVDLTSADKLITKVRLIDDRLSIGDLLQIAVDTRPELKHYEELRLAAKDAIKVAFAPLLPQVYGTMGGIMTAAKVSEGSTAGGSSSAGGGLLTGGGFSTSSATGAGGTGTGKHMRTAELFQIGLNVTWNIGGLGVTQVSQVQSARWQARKVQFEFNRKLNRVYEDVREAYLQSMDAENLIAETTDAVNSAREQLAVATTRLEEDVGTDLDVVLAQRDYTEALVSKANAIVKFNMAQARILRAIGRISAPLLTATRPMVR